MKKTRQRLVAILLVVIMIGGSAPLNEIAKTAGDFSSLTGKVEAFFKDLFSFPVIKAAATDSSGACGDNLEWTYYEGTGLLQISGTGDMYEYENSSDVGWFDIRSNIKKVVLNNDVSSIGESAFYYCTSLTEIDIPESVTKIGAYALYKCEQLLRIRVPATVLSISLTSIMIPDSVTYFGHGIFSGCANLISITIPFGVKTIFNYVFSNCSNLISVTIGKGVTYIGDSAFSGCTSLTSITVNSTNSAYSSDPYGILFNKNKTKLIMYPIGNTRMSYVIPDSVTGIEVSAFWDCESLTSVVVPNSVTSIGNSAFHNCTSLTDVYYSSSEDQWDVISIGSDNEPLTSAIIHYNSTGPQIITVTGVSLNKESISLSAGKTSQLTTTINPANASNKSVTWSSSDESIATVSNTGLVTAKAVGMATITATANDTTNGTLTDTCLVMVTPHVHHYVSTVTTAPTCTKTGVVTYTCSECGDSYTRLIPALGHNWGAWVTIKEPTTENGLKKRVCSLCGAVETEIIPAVSANFTVDAISNQTYTGFAITANVRAFSKADSSRLDEYEHFMVDYENNTAAGTATAVVTGKGSYHGTVSVNFNISAADISGARVETIPSVTSTGTALTPDPVIRYGGRLLVSGTDYTLAYANNVNPGTATITVTGKGSFTGSRTISFTILENNANFSVSEVGTQAWTGGTLTPDITVMSAGAMQAKSESAQSGGLLTEGVDYTLDYSGSTDIGFGTVTVTGIGNYSGTTKLIFRIECADLNGAAVADISGAVYTGTAYEPNLSGKLTFGGRTLVEGTDYIVEISRNILVGAAEIDIIGIGNYSGTITLYADITPEDISGSGFTVDGIADETYNGAAHTPDVILKKDGKALTPEIDYTVSYSNNIAAGTATATITGIGNYSGTRTVYFTVNPANAEAFSVADIADQPCTGGAVTPALTITFNGMTLVKGVDYTVSFSNNTAAGTATATITGIGNYTGTKTATFEIVTVPLEGITLNSTALSLQYKGTSKLTVTFNPTDATNKNVTWTSSNEKVAIVDANGNVTATGRGTATITATAEDGGKTATCTVTVKLVWWQWLINILLFGWIWY